MSAIETNHSQRELVPAIDILRGLAATAVFVCHLAYLGHWKTDEQQHLIWLIASYGWLGVDLFFVISGFVIARSALSLKDDRWFVSKFWINRFARIYPLYAVSSLAYLIFVDHAALQGADQWTQFFTHFFMIHAFFPSTAYSINPVTWTLSMEIGLYCIAFILVSTRSLHRTNAKYIAMTGILVAIFYRIIVFHLTPDQSSREFYTHQIPGMLDGFLMGAALSAFSNREIEEKFPRQATRLCFLALAVVCGIWLFITNGIYWQSWHSPALFRTLVALCFASLLIWSIGFAARGWLTSIFRRLGEVSYGIYLWHHMIITILVGAGLTRWELVAASSIATVVTAWISYRFVEIPIQRAIKNFSNRRLASSSVR